jgi:hypothetical protein
MTKKKPSKSPRWSIDAPGVIQALQAHITGKKPLDASQVEAALMLLKKRLPDAVRAKPPKRRKAQKEPDEAEPSLKDLE